jgi:ABC-type proline/glycine betaine transport system substrate-binding protein
VRKKPKATKPGLVKKVIPPFVRDAPEKAEISIPSADDLYREIRIANTLTDENGDTVKLKPGAEVEVTIEADVKATESKETSTSLHEKTEDKKR